MTQVLSFFVLTDKRQSFAPCEIIDDTYFQRAVIDSGIGRRTKAFSVITGIADKRQSISALTIYIFKFIR